MHYLIHLSVSESLYSIASRLGFVQSVSTLRFHFCLIFLSSEPDGFGPCLIQTHIYVIASSIHGASHLP
jgi:hypothetical protein